MKNQPTEETHLPNQLQRGSRKYYANPSKQRQRTQRSTHRRHEVIAHHGKNQQRIAGAATTEQKTNLHGRTKKHK